MSAQFRLDGQRVLITGASSGLGRAIAIGVNRAGGIAILSGRNADRLAETVSALDHGVAHETIVGDLKRDDDIARIADTAGSINGLVHAAGIPGPIPVRVVTREFLNDRFGTNYFAPMLLTQRILAKNYLQAAGSIVFISSIAAHTGTRGMSVYSATKSSLNVTAKCLALEVSKRGVRVNCLSPAMVRTPIFKPEEEGWLNESEKRYPLGLGEPEDVANAAVFLLAPASRWMTGQTLIMDGACEWI